MFGHDGAIEAGESDWAMRLYTPDQKYNALWRAMSVPPQPLLGATLASHAHHIMHAHILHTCDARDLSLL